MRRLSFTTLVLVLLATWVSGQPEAPARLASEQLRLFQPNRELLENLIEHSVELAAAQSPLDRVKACRAVANDLGRAMKDASERDDPDRVVELGEHLSAVIQHGLVPTIDDARTAIQGGSASQDLSRLTGEANDEINRYVESISFLGKVGTSSRVRTTRQQLMNARHVLRDRNSSTSPDR